MLPRIEALRAQLRPSEQKLAEYVLAAPREILDLSMTDLSARAGVSQPTIARFCQALGCSGFREFKIRLAQSVAPGVPSVYRDVEPDEPAPGIIGKVFDRTIGALIEVRNSLSAGSVAEAIALLSRASRIEFYGAGGSGIAAQDIQHKFFRLGVPSVAYSDPHTFSMSAALLGPQDIVVAISNTGRTRDIVEAAKSALACGAKVVSITHSHSPLAQLASVNLASNIAEETDVFSPMTSRMSHLAIGDILAVGVALQRGPELVDRLGRAKAAIVRRRIGPDERGGERRAAREEGREAGRETAREIARGESEQS